MEFVKIRERTIRGGIEIFPDYSVQKATDIMARGGGFYAVWDEKAGLWSTDERDVARLVDEELWAYHDKKYGAGFDGLLRVVTLDDFSSKQWTMFRNYISSLPDNYHQLDTKVTFADTKVKKKDYVSKRLPYSLSDGERPSYDELMSTLYDPEERAKLEWAIGSIFAGDSKTIQKFVVLYGSAGAGKSTVLNIIQKLFEGYFTTFEAKALVSSSNTFSMEAFRDNPLVAIQHDGDLSRIEDNTKLNSIVSHEIMTMNVKFRSSYPMKVDAFLFMATNKPVKITDAKSGIIRRLIDVRPSGRRLPPKKYQALYSQIDFELGAIASHCLDVYRRMGKNYYSEYVPIDMMYQTDVFFNFVEAQYYVFKKQDSTTLTQAYELYKVYSMESGTDKPLPRYKFREELKNYFREFDKVGRTPDGVQARSVYSGFMWEKFDVVASLADEPAEEHQSALVLDSNESLLDDILADCPAQYANEDEIPARKWANVKTVLRDLDTSRVHYVKPPLNHIVIDFDLKDETGEKSAELCIEEASKWPPTYAEYSKGGHGVHLHYIYDGDVSKLSSVYSPGIEVKVFSGNSSLRRRLSKCNNVPVATISGGLPLKEEKPVVDFDKIKNEKHLRRLILKGLNREVHDNTKPSVDYIYKVLSDAYESGIEYDVSDMYNDILAFAASSTNQASECLKILGKMKLTSKRDKAEGKEFDPYLQGADDGSPIVFFDVEVFPNLFVVCWKEDGIDEVHSMINPSPEEVGTLFSRKLVGFNNRRYDNHILYARYLGKSNEELYQLSSRIVNGKKGDNSLIGRAYSISYADIYDFSSKKQSLKKFEIDLDLHHQEVAFPWDKPVPEKSWDEVVEYCCNDVAVTDKVFHDRHSDFVAREILAGLSGLTPNDTTRRHAEKIIFGDDPNPQSKFVYTDLSAIFPGYKYEMGRSRYRGECPSEGGYVYSEPGIYYNVALLDIASMHPTSAELLNIFGPYTERYSDLKRARVMIKHGELDEAKKMFGGKLAPYLEGESSNADGLAYALKIIINSVYGFTSAKFPNKFKDPRNVDNIVAKRGALFMIDLKHAVQEHGYTVAHIKTDSIKIPNADDKIIKFVMDFGKKYGYTFEHEATYSKMCLVNKSEYIAKYSDDEVNGDHKNKWVAVGAKFQHPYVFKALFSGEPLEFKDKCEVRSVTTSLYLDYDESLPEGEHNYQFIGRIGRFCPIKPGNNAGRLMRKSGEDSYEENLNYDNCEDVEAEDQPYSEENKELKMGSAVGSKNYRWLESETVKAMKLEDQIDERYFRELIDAALAEIAKYGDPEMFRSSLFDNIDVPF